MTRKKVKYSVMGMILVMLPVLAFFISLSVGRYPVPLQNVFSILVSQFLSVHSDWTRIEEMVVINIRLPRVLLAMLVGSTLAVSGASFQGLFRNPLVSSHILGVAAGAGFGAAISMLFFSDSAHLIQFFAFAFGIIAVLGACVIGKTREGTSILMLVLGGIVVGALFTALISLMTYMADPEDELPAIVFWLMGSLANTSFDSVRIAAPSMLLGTGILLLLRWRINVLSLGEEEAQALGINTERMRWLIIVCATLATASAVSVSGIIGWVGLVIPHIGRMIVGSDHSILIPASASIGAVYLLFIDDIARTATAAEIPLGILTAIIGAPFFIYLLKRKGSGWA
jgi:iron complex transport system permease protein